jgi:acetyl esterase/lipase
MSEDRLLLDVSIPASPRNTTSLPVLDQIHGIGYAAGDSQSHPGRTLITHSKGSLIYVSIEYRLGPYGFLSSKVLKTDGTANAGLLDQRAALEWVQHHISVFGGDPERVSIIGGSAGGGSVTAQMMLYGGAPGLDSPPFRSAIAVMTKSLGGLGGVDMLSEYPFWQPYHDDSFVEAQYEQYFNWRDIWICGICETYLRVICNQQQKKHTSMPTRQTHHRCMDMATFTGPRL